MKKNIIKEIIAYLDGAPVDYRKFADIDCFKLYDFLNKHKIAQHSKNLFDNIHTRTISQHSAEVIEKTKNYIQKTQTRNEKLKNELYNLVKILNKNNINYVVLKGPVFAEEYYGDLSKRVIGDLDILVDKRQMDEIIAILEKYYAINKEEIGWLLQNHYHFSAYTPENLCIEIHWNIDYGTINYYDKFYSNSNTIMLNDQPIRVLSREDQIILFTVSISKDWFTRVGFSKYLDLNCIIADKNINWSQVMSDIYNYRLQHRFLIVLKIFSQLFIKHRGNIPEVKIDSTFYQKLFCQLFISVDQVYYIKEPNFLVRGLGEKIFWKDASYTKVPKYIDKGRQV